MSGESCRVKANIHELKQSEQQWRQWRRFLHQHPELSYQEKETTAFVRRMLTEWGIPSRSGEHGHGIIADIAGSRPGPTVALRADMDALPIQDQKTCDYRSRQAGVMHACGHDGHTSVLLGLAKFFAENRQELNGNVRLIFQHAEEFTPGGAVAMIRAGALEGVDVVYGIHLWTPLQVGHIASAPGPFMAAADEFTIDVRGKGGHAGLPHEAVDSIYIGSQLVQSLQGIVSRQINPVQPAVVSVCSFQGGSSFNIIADQCQLKGTVRTFDEQTRHQIHNRIRQLTEHVTTMHGGMGELHYQDGYPSVVNHAREFERFERIGVEQMGSERVQRMPYVMAGEDFAYYLQKVPGCFMFVGAGNPDKGMVYPHHHPLFDIDEDALLIAGELLVSMTLDYMQTHTE
ncbi:amidohydrolase [Marinicrinis sediminis]|uniref:Amidohydrolase n=1 Tax=Marinicrinis sediminis TaxID=1652465 RepID=A0ABW5R642_9BACL